MNTHRRQIALCKNIFTFVHNTKNNNTCCFSIFKKEEIRFKVSFSAKNSRWIALFRGEKLGEIVNKRAIKRFSKIARITSPAR